MAKDKTLIVLSTITDEEWEEAIIEITAYALKKIKRYKLPENFTAEDYFQEAVTRLFEERRKWEYEKKPDLIIHLKTIVKSLISADIKSKHNIKKENISDYTQNILTQNNGESCNSTESDFDSKQLFNLIENAVTGDYDLEILLLLLSEDQSRSRNEIAKELDWTNEKLDNSIRKLRRKKDDVLKEFKK